MTTNFSNPIQLYTTKSESDMRFLENKRKRWQKILGQMQIVKVNLNVLQLLNLTSL